ncbi:MAG: RNA methyltransferase [Bacilli bacterium]|nr:RNA methyltransferase [Bacilli bacterium]
MITSLENEKVKNVIKLQKKKYRDLSSTFIVEGEHLVREVYKEGLILELFVLEDVSVDLNVSYTVVSLDVMKKMSEMDSYPTMIAVCKKMEYSNIDGDKILLLDDIQDPGNLGTIIRSSVAFSVDTIVLSEQSVDLYNSKVIRATQGMFCHIPIIRMDLLDAIKKIREKNIPLYGTNVVNGVDVSLLKNEEKKKYCLVMGNEGNGVKKDIQMICDKNLYIPMNSKVESLNVGVACSILLYELGK